MLGQKKLDLPPRVLALLQQQNVPHSTGHSTGFEGLSAKLSLEQDKC